MAQRRRSTIGKWPLERTWPLERRYTLSSPSASHTLTQVPPWCTSLVPLHMHGLHMQAPQRWLQVLHKSSVLLPHKLLLVLLHMLSWLQGPHTTQMLELPR